MAGVSVAAGGWARWSYPVIALALGCLALVELLIQHPDAARLPYAVIASTVTVAAVALLPGRPLASVLGIAAGVGVLAWLLTVPPFATFLAGIVVCYGLVRHGSARAVAIGYGALAVVVGSVAAWHVSTGEDTWFGVVFPVIYFGGAGLLGRVTRHLANHLQLVEERSAALQREQEAATALAAANERARLARDLHDVVAHGVSLMVVQAEAAGEVMVRSPERAAAALDAIAETGRVAIADLHAMLDMLREDSAPAPGSAIVPVELGDLVGRIRDLGLTVNVHETGEVRPLPVAVARTTRRIVQEALTNTVRHADAAEVTVSLDFRRDELLIVINDDGTPHPPAVTGSGQGLRGMAERVAVHGGSVEAGPAPGHGFAVRARLPYSGGRAVAP
jgi:signal transduction histidine kinase